MKTTEEKNRMIAEFMGFEQTSIGWFDSNEILNLPYTSDNTFDNLLFHTSFDWLMPVVEKIESLGYTVNISRITTSIGEIGNEETMFSWVCGDVSKKLEITYQAAVQFIEWYNEQTK